ncbi:hypothetical protein IFR09_11655 [Pseudomonas syringae]|nr:hypothetical protein [Pseudomonas syringae]MBD8801836.1 hypothetical protein [Pseudomonas syringae]MBD8811814.1 hypothetical protein [Pseudomonas syringae]
MKFDCARVSGKVDEVRNVSSINGGYTMSMVIDGAIIPNMKMAKNFYEDLEIGQNITLYGFFKNSKSKEKNDCVVYGMRQEGGETRFVTHYRFFVPIIIAFSAALAAFYALIAGWVLSFIVLSFFVTGYEPLPMMYKTTVAALVEAALVGLYCLWPAWTMIKITAKPDDWKVIDPATLSSRFSKFHK